MTSKSAWLPKRRAGPRFGQWDPWRPAELEGVDLGELSYIVVDEIVEPTAVLAVTEWPRVDRRGRVRFRLDQSPHLVRVAIKDLAQHLAKHRVGAGSRKREVRIGDVYAAVARTSRLPKPQSGAVAPELAPTELGPVADWLGPKVYDISGAAREAAKIALYGAVAPLLKPEETKGLARKR
jgi:hypothetical protein